MVTAGEYRTSMPGNPDHYLLVKEVKEKANLVVIENSMRRTSVLNLDHINSLYLVRHYDRTTAQKLD